jgi:DNA-binding MarR family transcriptional regulator
LKRGEKALETIIQPEQTQAVYLRLLRQEAMLSRILDELERVQHKLSNRADSDIKTIRNRRLRILRVILENNENANITEIARLVEADGKTVRADLDILSAEGLLLYMTGKKKSNPGRRGNRPKLTGRGWKTAEAAFDLDRRTREAF